MNPNIPANRLKQRLQAGQLSLCMGVRQARTADIAAIAAACGFDALYVDMEHSPISLDATSMLCLAAAGADLTPLVRIPGHDGDLLARVLDSGAQGVIVPHVDTAEQARGLAGHAKYPPVGHRSVMSSGPATAYRSVPLGEMTVGVNAQTLLVAMIETPEGVANADEIAAVEGIDMLLVGSNDLSVELGLPGRLDHPELMAAYRAAGQACARHGKALGIGGVRSDPALQSALLEMGARFMIAGNDVGYLAAAARQDVQALRKAAGTG